MISNVIFVVDNLSIPRCIKRIKAFYDEGISVIVYGYDRGKNLNNQFPQEIRPIILGSVLDGKGYVSRFFNVRRDIKRIIEENKHGNNVFYSFGFVSSLLFSLTKERFIYEISDIRYGSYKIFSPFICLFKYIDKRIVRKSLATVMTSGGFKDYLGAKKKEIFLIPNKINPVLANQQRSLVNETGQGIRFAFVGSVRYKSVFRFAKVIAEFFPQHSFSFYGSAPDWIKDLCEKLAKQYDNISYYGPFHNPEDLPSIYGNADVIVSSYDVSTLNERIAEPNKLYESIFFCRPIVVSENTFLSKQVERYHCGFSLDATNETLIKGFIESIQIEDLLDCSRAELKIPVCELIDETKSIIEYVKSAKL